MLSSRSDRYDVVIAGAGPAGSVCAYTCAKRGLAVLLLDRDPFPRNKPCGGAVAERALALLDFPLPPELIEEECRGAKVRLRDHSITVRMNERIAILVRRERFDSFLAEQAVRAGARFVTGEAVTGIEQREDAVEVRTDRSVFTGRYVVGADGVQSVVARTLRPTFPKTDTALALVCAVPAVRESGGDDLLDMRFGIAPLGYGWVFPRGAERSVGIMGRASRFNRPREALDRYAREAGITPTDVRGHFIPYGGIRRTIASGRVVLAGDAAGFGDAFTGEGIVHAIHSGKLAADAVAKAMDTGNSREALAEYQRDSDRLITRDLRAARLLAEIIDRFPGLSIRIFLHHRRVMERYFGIPTGKTSYRDFLAWLLPRMPASLVSSLLGSGAGR